jgi:hypothetical protein
MGPNRIGRSRRWGRSCLLSIERAFQSLAMQTLSAIPELLSASGGGPPKGEARGKKCRLLDAVRGLR